MMTKRLWKVSIPHFDLYRHLRAASPRQAVLAALRRLERERPDLKGTIHYDRWLGDCDEYTTLVG